MLFRSILNGIYYQLPIVYNEINFSTNTIVIRLVCKINQYYSLDIKCENCCIEDTLTTSIVVGFIIINTNGTRI